MANKQAEWLTAKEATRALDVKLETLYAYVSRGLVTSTPGVRGRGRLYSAEDIARLKARHDARSGHGAVAAGALRFGEPVLETAISDVRPEGPRYRGHSVASLVEREVGFEAVCELLWTGSLPEAMPAAERLRLRSTSRDKRVGEGEPILRLAAVSAVLALDDVLRVNPLESVEIARARSLVPHLAAQVGRPGKAAKTGKVSEILLHAFGHSTNALDARLVDQALVICADHELNASTFAARVCASAGASLCAALCAGFQTLSGAKHGGMCERVEALLAEASTLKRPSQVVMARLHRGEALPGYGHPLYPSGDPRGKMLLALAARVKNPGAEYRAMCAIHAAVERAGQPMPTLDAGLVTLTSALRLPRGSASAIFAIGRMAGWIAHILEQRRQDFILRPRARYVGPS